MWHSNKRISSSCIRRQPPTGSGAPHSPVNIEDTFISPVYPKSAATFNFIVKSLVDSVIFSSLTDEERYTLIDAMEMDSVSIGTPIIKQGDAPDYFYVLQHGNVTFFVDGQPRGECTCGAFFGEVAMLYNCTRSATCIAASDCTLWRVDEGTFRYTLANHVRRRDSMKTLQCCVDGCIPQHLRDDAHSTLDPHIQFKDIVKHQILGSGTFSKVWLVSHQKNNGKTYALKIMNKHEIIRHHQVEGVLREKNIVSSIHHPFAIELVSTFKDEKSLYMLFELVEGGELFNVIHTKTNDGVSDAVAQFYAACILDILSHLHHHHICYRDLKPENILIDKHGYCVLVDFGFAKVVDDKTYTQCGTPQYLAPEVICSDGHNEGVDCWAFGVLIYEMIVGRSPFYAPDTDEISLFQRIIDVNYSFPPNGIMKEAPNGNVNEDIQDVIRHLLVKSQSIRSSCHPRSKRDIRNHAWFSSIDFNKLSQKLYCAPWIPNIPTHLNAMNFDSYNQQISENDEQPSCEPHLSSYQQSLFQGFGISAC